MTRVFTLLLDVQMGANPFIDLLRDDLAWADRHSAAHQIDDARAAILASSKLKHADGDVERCASAACSPVALLRGPRVWL